MNTEISLQFQNIAAWLNWARYTAEWSTQFFVSKNPESIYDDPRTNINSMVDPILSHDTDVVSFSEVFGVHQRNALQQKLESRGYTVYCTSAFEMWSQSVEWEHLYNVTGIKSEKLWIRRNQDFTFRNKRPIEWLAISLKYLLSHWLWEWERGKVNQAMHLRNRLANGILDGAISIFEFDDFTLATGHVHKFNAEVQKILEDNTTDKPFILLWDMNVSHGKDILTKPPFNWPEWSSFIHPEMRTFWFVAGLGMRDRMTLAMAHMQPDVFIWKGVRPVDIRLIQSPSDHNWIYWSVQI